MGRVLKGIVVCHTHDFKGDLNEKIKRWVEHNGGTLSKTLAPEVTHVISSTLSWKRYTPLIKEARRKKIRIVKLDWLIDSLTLGKRKRLDETEYYFEKCNLPRYKPIKKRHRPRNDNKRTESENVHQRLETKSTCSGKGLIEFDKVCLELRVQMNTEGYHLYKDSVDFEYCVDLTRIFGPGLRLEKHRLQIYESDRTPQVYALYTCFLQGDRSASLIEMLMPPGSSWDLTWAMFCKFFKQRTSLQWTIEKQRCCTARSNKSTEYEEERDVFCWDRPLQGEAECCGLLEQETMVTNEDVEELADTNVVNSPKKVVGHEEKH